MATKAKPRSAKQADLLSLIETMRWEPGTGFLRLDQHLRRLNRSADALGFRSAPADLVKQLQAAVCGDAPLHVHLAMTFRGNIEITATPFAPVAEDTVWRIGIAETRLPSDDPMYRHKTTRREIYETARAEFEEDKVQEVIMLNERGEICEGTTTNIFVEQPDGTLITPPISCGLIAGILRGDLIREGRAKSGLVGRQDLAGARFFVGNALRGLIRAELIEA